MYLVRIFVILCNPNLLEECKNDVVLLKTEFWTVNLSYLGVP